MVHANRMLAVFCPVRGLRVMANSTAKGGLRCVACGNEHVEAKRFSLDLEPVATKRNKFKKGKKAKGKKKGSAD